MSYAALNWAWQADIPTGPKMVLVALADQAGHREDTTELVTVAGQERLAAMTSMSVRSIARHLAWLEDRGYITRTTRRRPDGYRTSDTTTLNLDSTPTTETPTTETNSLPVSPDNLSAVETSPDTVSPDIGDDLTGQSGRPHLTQCPVLKETPSRTTSRTPRGAQGAAPSGDDPVSKPSRRGTRIPDPFVVTDAMRQWAANEFPWLDVAAATDEFVDYWRGVPGARGVKVDWPGTWRNSLRKTARMTPAWKRRELEAALVDPTPIMAAPAARYDGDPDDDVAYDAWIAAQRAEAGAR